VTLPRSLAFPALKEAGLQADEYRDLGNELLIKQSRREALPDKPQVKCIYAASVTPIAVRVIVLRYGLPTELRIEVADAAVGEKIRNCLLQFAGNHQDRIAAELEHTAIWEQVESTLANDGLSYHQILSGEGVLSRRAIEAVMQLCGGARPSIQQELHPLLTMVARPDREFVARWLMEQFERPDASDQLGIRIYEVAVPAIADDLIRIIQDRRYGERRGDLCLSLAKIKHKRAAEVIASQLGEDGVTRWAIECLGRLRAVQYVEEIRKFLHATNPDIRREVKKTLTKLGFPSEAPPPSVHLVKKRTAIPKNLDEWSANLDFDELSSTMEALAECITSGIGPAEIREVVGVVEMMNVGQTKAFRFAVMTHGREDDLWLVIFLDDVDAPDLAVHADARLIDCFRTVVDGN
jgi:hypothetical protein